MELSSLSEPIAVCNHLGDENVFVDKGKGCVGTLLDFRMS